MTEVRDADLLRQFARNGSEDAFTALVQRHIGLVYFVALRHTAQPQQAEDITQAVFIILARKAGGLGPKTVLPGWLYHTARLTAANWQRAEIRRVRREHEAYMQSQIEESPTDNLWRELSPQLDRAMADLGTVERDALVLCYFQNKCLAEVGQSLGLTENAAQKRVHQALERLRRFFSKRGVDSTAASIADNLSTHSIQPVPAALAKSVAAVALAKGAAASASTLALVKGALKIMAWTKAKTAIVAGVAVLLAAGTTTLTVHHMGAPMRSVQSEWSAISGNDGQWSWSGGKIEAHTIDGDSIFASSKKYGDVTFSAVGSTSNGEASLAIRMQDGNNGYLAVIAPSGTVPNPVGFVRLVKRVSGNEIRLATYQGKRLPVPGKPFNIKVVAKGPLIEVFLNGANILRAHDATFTNGCIGLRVYGWGDYPCDATFSGVRFD